MRTVKIKHFRKFRASMLIFSTISLTAGDIKLVQAFLDTTKTKAARLVRTPCSFSQVPLSWVLPGKSVDVRIAHDDA